MRARTALLFVVVAVAAAALGLYWGTWRTEGRLPFARAASAKALPELTFEDASGKPHTLADFRGKFVLLNIWATWCAPCREEMPALDRLQAQMAGERFQVVALSVDQQGLPVARKFYAETGIKALPLYIDRSAKAAFTLDAAGLPATLLVDPAGREVGRHLGAVKWDSPEVMEHLRRRVNSPP
jgi:thiol-disulfide isomerase/thioredoxin